MFYKSGRFTRRFTTKPKRRFTLSDEAKEQLANLPPDDQVKLYRAFEAIAMDPSIGEPLTPENCPHPASYVKDGTCQLCDGTNLFIDV